MGSAVMDVTRALILARNGVPGANCKVLSDLTDAEAQKVCEWDEEQATSIRPSKTQLCTAVAVGFSTSEDECTELVDECVTSADVHEGDALEEGDCDVGANDLVSCDAATVGEFETCMKAFVDAVRRKIASVSCANAGEDLELDSEETLAACRNIEEHCPDLLDGIAEEEE